MCHPVLSLSHARVQSPNYAGARWFVFRMRYPSRMPSGARLARKSSPAEDVGRTTAKPGHASPATSVSVRKDCKERRKPCPNALWGCRNQSPAADGTSCCHQCVTRGEPCRGPLGKGCAHPFKKYPRRAAPGNSHMCFMCNRPSCKHRGCNKPVHNDFWHDGFCRKHGRDERGDTRRRRQTTPEELRTAHCL